MCLPGVGPHCRLSPPTPPVPALPPILGERGEKGRLKLQPSFLFPAHNKPTAQAQDCPLYQPPLAPRSPRIGGRRVPTKWVVGMGAKARRMRAKRRNTLTVPTPPCSSFSSCSSSLPAHADNTVVVGSKKFTESYVLAEIAKKTLTDAGFAVEHRQGIGATGIVWEALKTGAIQVYPEYTGTIGEEILKSKTPLTPDAMRAALSALRGRDGRRS